MAGYLLQISYTPEAWAVLMKNPHDRLDAVRGVIEKLGGKVGAFWVAFGEHDLVGILAMPDNIAAAAFSMALAAGGACRSVRTTPLLTIEDAIAAMRKGADCGYTPLTAQG